jgi:uncharacterized repeat protein (TIGR01451 family)
MKNIFLLFNLLFLNNLTFSQIQIGQDIDGIVSGEQSGYTVCMPEPNTVAIGSINNDVNGAPAGHVKIYTLINNVWIQKGQVLVGEYSNNLFGESLFMPDENTIAIGDGGNNEIGSMAGSVRIFFWDGNVWLQKGFDIDGEFSEDRAFVVCMPDSNTIAIGSPSNDNINGFESGSVRVFCWNGNTWIQKGINLIGDTSWGNAGSSLSMSDSNTLVIGSPSSFVDGLGYGTGKVRIFVWNGNDWMQKGLEIVGEAMANMAGYSVSMPDPNTVAVGAVNNSGNGTNSGHVRIYKWFENSWTQKGLDIDGEFQDDWSGIVSMPDSNTVAIAARLNDGNGESSGHVRVFSWFENTWIQKGKDIDGEAQGDVCGYSISMPDANTIAIGSYRNDGIAIDAGSVRIFKFKGVQGYIYNDLNQNCQIEAELGLGHFSAIIQPGNLVVETEENGRWFVDSLPIGNYTITMDTNNSQWQITCPSVQNFSVLNTNALTMTSNCGFVNTFPCPTPNISINMPFIRPGFNNQKIYISACNDYTGTGVLENAFVEILLDELITIDSSSLPFTYIEANLLRVDLGNLNPGYCSSFYLNSTLSIDAILGQTLCLEANLFPIQSCAVDTIIENPTFPAGVTPCNLPWDHSSLNVDGWCANDSIYFTITNTGNPSEGDMDCYSPVRIYLDGQMIQFDSIMFLGGQTVTYAFLGTGQTWRLEADQHPLHPGNSHPNANVELCGDAQNWTPDLITVLPQDDGDPVVDIYCGIVTGSFDPNDKKGFPLGVGQNHDIMPNQNLEYMIRFQNTGTDTAFTVVIRDTLDFDLDIFSVVSGVSNHNYNFTIHGPRVLEWTFNNILLPDSTTNLEGSNGFVTFSVKQNSDLPNGSQITNNAGIYFDFNAPIITNQTLHTINSCIQNALIRTLNESVCESYQSPYGQVYTQSGIYIENLTNPNGCDSTITINLSVNNPTSSSITESSCQSYIAPDGQVYSQSGIYFAIIPNSNGCDSSITIDLTVNNPSTSSIIESVCQSYTAPDGQIYSQSGTYIAIIPNSNGCDSSITIDLTVNNPSTSSIIESVCQTYTAPDGQIYSQSGTYLAIIPNSNGCDSTITIDLTIESIDLSISQNDFMLTADQSDATYQWLDCENGNAAISGATNQSFTPETNGEYAVFISNSVCSDTSDCIVVNGIGLAENENNFIRIYPNPANDNLNLTCSNSSDFAYKLMDTKGKVLEKSLHNQKEFKIDIKNLSEGVYFIELNFSGRIYTEKIIKK